MSARMLLVGPLADPALLTAVGIAPAAGPVELPGRLSGGGRAGIVPDGWPVLDAQAPGSIQAVPVLSAPRLDRYAAIMGLAPLDTPQGAVLGGVRRPGPGASDARWQPALAAQVARDVLALPDSVPPEEIAARLPMIAWWAASRLRAADERGEPLPPGPSGADRVRVSARAQPYARYFAVEEMRLTHRLHNGGWSQPLLRAVFVSGDAVVVLPWDPVRDRVLVVDQFRAGPAARGDGQPWLLEPVAGRIDAGETPESTAMREAREEAGLALRRLIRAPGHYPSPGIAAEFIYGFVGVVDLPDGVATVNGLESEGEDIRGHLFDRTELTHRAMEGLIANGPLALLALWLDRMSRDPDWVAAAAAGG